MFKKNKNVEATPQTVATPVLNSASPLAVSRKPAATVIASGIRLDGNIIAEGDVDIYGTVSGNIDAEESQIKIMTGGLVEGNITCRELIIDGCILGQCRSETIEIDKNGYYGYNDYYGNNYDYSYALDPSKSLQMFGVAVGFGKRLNWPDDYFTLSAELGYQLYKLKDWEYLYFMQNGTSHSITLNLTLARNSIDNPIYTRRGSQFSLSLQLTPPYSLFNNVDYSKLDPSNNKKDRETMYKWIEYHKWKFKAKTFTPLTSAESQHTLVLMTRAEVGILGSYNRHKRSPFETFYVGGDGMSGYSYNYATETIALRGYENGSLTPYGYEGYAYTRLGVELHFPVILQPSSTIYALAFAEAGNAWTEVRDFNPFKLKRSAGVGVRIFLPMIGMMGLDWAYGFDKPFTGVQKVGGSQLHFILGQEF